MIPPPPSCTYYDVSIPPSILVGMPTSRTVPQGGGAVFRPLPPPWWSFTSIYCKHKRKATTPHWCLYRLRQPLSLPFPVKIWPCPIVDGSLWPTSFPYPHHLEVTGRSRKRRNYDNVFSPRYGSWAPESCATTLSAPRPRQARRVAWKRGGGHDVIRPRRGYRLIRPALVDVSYQGTEIRSKLSWSRNEIDPWQSNLIRNWIEVT